MQTKLNIILVIYNEPFEITKNAIDSLINQSNKNFNVWVVFNGSQTCEIDKVKRYLTNEIFVKYIILKENIGYCGARQAAIDKINGGFIAFLDADDYLDVDYVTNFYDSYLENIDLYVINFYSNFNNKNKKKAYITKWWKFRKCFSYTAAWTKIISKDFLDKKNIQFYIDKMNIVEDMYFHLKVLINARKIKYIPFRMYFYNVRKDSNTSKKKKLIENIDDLIIVKTFTKIYNEYKKNISLIFYFLLLNGDIKKYKLFMNEININSFIKKKLIFLFAFLFFFKSIIKKFFNFI